MTKPLTIVLELIGLVMIMHGWANQDYATLGIGLAVALIGAVGIRNRLKADKRVQEQPTQK